MRPPESFLSQPIRNLQTMLRVIAKQQNHPRPLIPDGIYGPETMQAVSEFQKQHGLPPTGTADRRTWDAILNCYHPARISLIPAQPLHVLMEPQEILQSGDSHPNLYLVQAMLEVISKAFLSVEHPGFSGCLDTKTVNALKSFQLLCGLQESGKLDKITWKHLALQYPLAALRCVQHK